VRSARALGLAAALALPACALGPDYERPSLPAAESFRGQAAAETTSIADLPWWEVFGDAALAGLIQQALADNLDLQTAAARVEQARYLAGVTRSELFPEVGYEGDSVRGKQSFLGGVSPGVDTDNSQLAVFTLSWELDVWGRIRRATEAARAELIATEAFRRGVVLGLVTGVAQAYFELRELDLELEIAQRTEASFQETFQLFQRQYEGGVTSRLDPLRAQAARAQAAASIPDLERRIVAKENELSVLLGRVTAAIPRGDALAAQSLPPEVPAGVPSTLLERRPDLVEAEQILVASNARIGVAKSEFFPRIALTGFQGSVSRDLSDLFDSGSETWSLGGIASGPLLSWGRTYFAFLASKAESEQALLQYQQSMLGALREVSDALTAREKLALVRAEQQLAVDALRESLRIARIRYRGGLATYLEVLDAQQQLFPAENALAQTQRDELLAVVALYRALGGGWSTYGEPPRLPSPLAP
jgi:multidrug efflux system outer membrane protein